MKKVKEVYAKEGWIKVAALVAIMTLCATTDKSPIMTSMAAALIAISAIYIALFLLTPHLSNKIKSKG